MNAGAVRRWLIRHADNYTQNLILLIAGFLSCFIGLAIVVASEYLLAASVQQELVALLGLIVAGGGSILAFFAFTCLSVLRLFRFLIDDNPHE